MDLDEFTITVYCLVDELLDELAADPGWGRVRQRGPTPILADAEVLTMEVVGEYLGVDQDVAIYDYFRREHPALFAQGTYVPLEATGAHAEYVVAFARRHAGTESIVVVPRLLARLLRNHAAPLGDVWERTSLVVVGATPDATYTNLFTGEQLEVENHDGSAVLPLSAIFANFPVALLVRTTP